MITNVFWVFAFVVIVHLTLGFVFSKEIRAGQKEEKHYARIIYEMAREKGGWRYVLLAAYCLMIGIVILLAGITMFMN